MEPRLIFVFLVTASASGNGKWETRYYTTIDPLCIVKCSAIMKNYLMRHFCQCPKKGVNMYDYHITFISATRTSSGIQSFEQMIDHLQLKNRRLPLNNLGPDSIENKIISKIISKIILKIILKIISKIISRVL